MKLMDLIVDELNNSLSDKQRENGEWERLHSEQYQIVKTENGLFHNPINSRNGLLTVCKDWLPCTDEAGSHRTS